MAKPRRPKAPSSPTPAAARRNQASRVRTAVRTQLARSQRRRQELSHGLRALRRDLREFRNQVRMRLREMSHEVTTRRLASRSVAPADRPEAIAAVAAPLIPALPPVAAAPPVMPVDQPPATPQEPQ